MPLFNGSFDLAISCGCFPMLRYLEGYAALNRELCRVLKGDGRFAMRAFVRPERSESLAAVFHDLSAGRIGNFHIFKWRLARALHGSLGVGVRPADTWSAWNDVFPDPAMLAKKLNWRISTIRTNDAYRELDTCYTFSTIEELRHAVSAHFSETACIYPPYEMGDRCPTLFFTLR